MTKPCVSPTPGSLVGYHRDKCRCDGCLAASATYYDRMRRHRAYGTWKPLIDAEPARQHVRTLLGAGLGRRRVAALAGISENAIRKLLGTSGRPPQARIRPATAQQILAATAGPSQLAAGTHIDATGTRRRIQALMVIGWPLAEQARQLGLDPRNFNRTFHGTLVTVATARAISDLYERLWNQAPPATRVKTLTIRYARSHQYAPPLAWDDIDDPTATPIGAIDTDTIDQIAVERALLGDTTVHLTNTERREAHRIGTSRGLSAKQLAAALQVDSRTITRARTAARAAA